MAYPENCPKCKKSMRGEKIPKKDQKNFGGTHFYRVIGLYDRDKDMTTRWMCPDCEHIWPRE